MPNPSKKIPTKIAKKFKKLKKLISALFLSKRIEWGREREKKILAPNSVHIRAGQENSEKIAKKFKNLFLLFFSPKRDEIDRKREKKKIFSLEFRSNSA